MEGDEMTRETIEQFVVEKLKPTISALRDENERLRGALKFYAAMNEHPRDVCIATVIDQDRGEKAIKALAERKPG